MKYLWIRILYLIVFMGFVSCMSDERPIEDVMLEDQSLDIDGQPQDGNESDLSDSPGDSTSTTEADLSDSSDIDTSTDSTSCESSYRCPCDYDTLRNHYCCAGVHVYECGQNGFWERFFDVFCGDPEYPADICPWVILPPQP